MILDPTVNRCNFLFSALVTLLFRAGRAGPCRPFGQRAGEGKHNEEPGPCRPLGQRA